MTKRLTDFGQQRQRRPSCHYVGCGGSALFKITSRPAFFARVAETNATGLFVRDHITASFLCSHGRHECNRSVCSRSWPAFFARVPGTNATGLFVQEHITASLLCSRGGNECYGSICPEITSRPALFARVAGTNATGRFPSRLCSRGGDK